MIMKRTIFHLWQTCGLRLAVCTMTLGLTTVIYAQTDDDDTFEEETTTTIKQPKRTQVKQAVYPTKTLQGVVIDQALNTPLAGVQL